MPEYETLRLIWWLLLGLLLIGFAVMDGFDLGLATIYRFVARSDEERRVLLESIEPVWEGNQVWLVLGAGAIFAAWPLLYATAFSGFYFAMLLILAALILRPVGFMYRNKLEDARWRELWDWALFAGGAVPALLFGVAFGNLFLGLPFHFDALARPVFTGGFLGLLRPFALLVGLVSLSMSIMHGAAYAALKTEAPLARRARVCGSGAALVLVMAFTLAGIWIAGGVTGLSLAGTVNTGGPSNPLLKIVTIARGGWLTNYIHQPWLWLAPAAAYAGIAVTWLGLRAARPGLAFVASSIVQASVILTAAFGLFPFLLPSSTTPAASLTVWDASASRASLWVMLICVAVFMPLVLIYTAWVFRVMRGQVTLAHIRAQHDGY